MEKNKRILTGMNLKQDVLMRGFFGAGLFLTLILSTSCSTTRKLAYNSHTPGMAEANYVVAGETVGQGETNYIFGIPSGEPNFGNDLYFLSSGNERSESGVTAEKVILMILFPPYLIYSIITGRDKEVIVESSALKRAKFDALAKVQGATHFHSSSTYWEKDPGSLFYSERVTVKGRAITVTGSGRRTDY